MNHILFRFFFFYHVWFRFLLHFLHVSKQNFMKLSYKNLKNKQTYHKGLKRYPPPHRKSVECLIVKYFKGILRRNTQMCARIFKFFVVTFMCKNEKTQICMLKNYFDIFIDTIFHRLIFHQLPY